MTDSAKSKYDRLYTQIHSLVIKTDDIITRMATINAILYHKMQHYFWVGFYLLKNEKLLAGPYQGPLACQELAKDKGICWAGINARQTIIVPDVHKYPGHIACDSRSNSEIVVPLINPNNEILGVLDVDSRHKSAFNDLDKKYLEKISELLWVI